MLDHDTQQPAQPLPDPAVPLAAQSPAELPCLLAPDAVLGLEFGFVLARVEPVPELRAEARIYRHVATGADILVVQNDDPHLCFGCAFPTRARDDRGTPHVAEHWVFRGSERFPGSDPINTYLQQSLASDSNAETGHDSTVFYFATPNRADFDNHLATTLDAVFRPLLTDDAFRDEAFRFESDEKPGRRRLNGIVLNEMKWYYSDPLEVHGQLVVESLFPDTHYRFDPGGKPLDIPDLTPDEVRRFVRESYRPARFFAYGAIVRQELFETLDRTLQGLPRRESDGTPRVEQPWFSAPKRIEGFYAGGETEDAGRDSIVSVSWRLGRGPKCPADLELLVLQSILLDYEFSPLRAALSEAELGEDLLEDCIGDELLETYFTIGLTGTAAAKTLEIEAAILEALRRVVDEGIPPSLAGFALDALEHELRRGAEAEERGSDALSEAFAAWDRGEDPIAQLRWEEELRTLRERAAHPGYFESLVRRHLLENEHRVTLTVRPRRSLTAEWQAHEDERVELMRAAGVVPHSSDARESSDKIPRLRISDLPRQGRRVESSSRDGVRLYPTAGASYVQFGAAVNLRSLPMSELPLAAALAAVLPDLLEQRVQTLDRYTGELDSSIEVHNTAAGGIDARIVFTGECVAKNAPALVDILSHILSCELGSKRRMLQLLLEAKAEVEHELHSEGFDFAYSCAGAKLDAGERVCELTSGIEYLAELRRLIGDVRHHWGPTRERLEAVRQLILAHGSPELYLVGSEREIEPLVPCLTELRSRFGAPAAEPPPWHPAPDVFDEGYTIPSQINHLARAFHLRAAGLAAHGSTAVMVKLLEHGFLWPRIRQQRGAYSPGIQYHADSGILYLGSSVDVNIVQTIDAYARASEWLREIAPRINELRRSKIGAIGEEDAPQSAAERAFEDFVLRLRGMPEDYAARWRSEIFDAGREHVLALADALDRAAAAASPTVVLGSRAALTEANRLRGHEWLQIRSLE